MDMSDIAKWQEKEGMTVGFDVARMRRMKTEPIVEKMGVFERQVTPPGEEVIEDDVIEKKEEEGKQQTGGVAESTQEAERVSADTAALQKAGCEQALDEEVAPESVPTSGTHEMAGRNTGTTAAHTSAQSSVVDSAKPSMEGK
ncbi:hypothetical protein DXG01_014293 [Tephrocybe rancida]|nr:hypothetical protein DXG01_014318 [Tephrocybe rancida]KAG6903862.1 hypothetical protein DXG01_014293 [Tephrocybe rancida]